MAREISEKLHQEKSSDLYKVKLAVAFKKYAQAKFKQGSSGET